MNLQMNTSDQQTSIYSEENDFKENEYYLDYKRRLLKKLEIAKKSEYYSKACLLYEEIHGKTENFSDIEKEANLKKAISCFMDCALKKRGYLEEAVKIIIELFLSSKNNQSDLIILKSVLEPLKDSFGIEEEEIYLYFFSTLIDQLIEKSEKLKFFFNEFGIPKKNRREYIIKRYFNALKNLHTLTNEDKSKIKEVFILSRATIGADALITGIILSKIKKEMPFTNITFIDSLGIGGALFNIPKIKNITEFKNEQDELISLKWNRNEFSLLERLNYSADLWTFLKSKTKKLNKTEYLIIDPSTRLSQTGLMPVSPLFSYFLMPFHMLKENPITNEDCKEIYSLGDLTNIYLDKIFGKSEKIYPCLYLNTNEENKIKSLWQKLSLNKDFVTIVHLGGEPESKWLSEEFEINLLRNLIEKKLKPILIRTPNRKEEEKNKCLIEMLEKGNKKIVQIEEGENIENEDTSKADIYTFKGSISSFAPLIKNAQLYIGYDSLGQHLAAALEIPLITIFAGHINKVFLRRWTPFSKKINSIIEVNKQGTIYQELEVYRKKCDSITLSEIMTNVDKIINNS